MKHQIIKTLKHTQKEYQKLTPILLTLSTIGKGQNVQLGKKTGKKFEQNNKTIALNALFVPHNTETIRVAYRSEYNHKRKDQINLLMITDSNK